MVRGKLLLGILKATTAAVFARAINQACRANQNAVLFPTDALLLLA